MRLLPVLLLVVPLSILLDYIHVAYMCRGCVFPSPMFIMFSVTLTTLAVAIYALTATKTREGEVHGEIDPSVIASLLREPDRSMYMYLVKHGGEALVATVAKELGLNKLRAWRAAQRLQEKGLVILEKHRGRLVMRLRAKQLSVEPNKEQREQPKKQQHGHKP